MSHAAILIGYLNRSLPIGRTLATTTKDIALPKSFVTMLARLQIGQSEGDDNETVNIANHASADTHL